jgi:hypothetical protein
VIGAVLVAVLPVLLGLLAGYLWGWAAGRWRLRASLAAAHAADVEARAAVWRSIHTETAARGLFPGDRVRMDVWIGPGLSAPVDFEVRRIRRDAAGVATLQVERRGRTLEQWQRIANASTVRKG